MVSKAKNKQANIQNKGAKTRPAANQKKEYTKTRPLATKKECQKKPAGSIQKKPAGRTIWVSDQCGLINHGLTAGQLEGLRCMGAMTWR